MSLDSKLKCNISMNNACEFLNFNSYVFYFDILRNNEK